MGAGSPPKLIYLVTEDWYFLSHRMPMARAARDAGFEVVVATRVNRAEDRQAIETEGFRVVPLDWTRGSRNPLTELMEMAAIARLYRREKPAIVHHVAMKPVLEGGIAAWIADVPAIVNALTGLGAVFIGRGLAMRLLRPAIRLILRVALDHPRSRLVMQNQDDLDLMLRKGLVSPDRTVLIPGSGVDIAKFAPSPEPAGPLTAALVARMLSDKGVGELVEAARLLKQRGVTLRVRLVGPRDDHNPAAIPADQLEAWVREGLVEWPGEVKDVAGLWRDTAIAVLPSYREGLPKSLLEAAASGRPMIATDVPGCREVVRHGETGLLVPPRDPVALADALQTLAGDAGLRRRYGQAARKLAEERFSDQAIAQAMVRLYQDQVARAERKAQAERGLAGN
ncbi:MAG: glycosyltransferase family 4 protein [Rhodospirillales bacterium]|nr:glycosyltransferase family 4 protein [Rhodospirillales bacterium]